MKSKTFCFPLLLLTASLAACGALLKSTASGGHSGPDSASSLDSMCSPILEAVSGQPSLGKTALVSPQAILQAQGGDIALLSQEIGCLREKTYISGELITADSASGPVAFVQLEQSKQAESHSFLGVAWSENSLDIDNDRQPDFTKLEVYDARNLTFRATDTGLRADLAQVEFNPQTATTQPTGGSATLTIDQGSDGELWFIFSLGKDTVSLTQEQFESLPMSIIHIDQINAAFQARAELKLDQVPGVDLGLKGEKYGLPDAVNAQMQEMGGAAVLAEGGIAGAKDDSGCGLALPDHLVSGETIQPASDGVVEYTAVGSNGTEALWQIPVAKEVSCVAFVAKEGNQWGLKPGTVGVWFYHDAGKAGSTVLNPDNPLRPMYDSANTAKLTTQNEDDTQLTQVTKLVIKGPDGQVVDKQEVSAALLPFHEFSLKQAYSYLEQNCAPLHIPPGDHSLTSIIQASQETGPLLDEIGYQGERGFPNLDSGLITFFNKDDEPYKECLPIVLKLDENGKMAKPGTEVVRTVVFRDLNGQPATIQMRFDFPDDLIPWPKNEYKGFND